MEPETEVREVEITWNELGEATIKFMESDGSRTRTTTQFGWIEPSDPDLSDGLGEWKLTVRLGRAVGQSRGLIEERP
ncbi:hypothetical protein [Streptomyces spectabilis]|uniref:Uncharacterized protein n=1 Tax=Streptomyces spectabilis TaxID=68270 RepID=A0A5P2X2A7_STRST|nr:hypothetical protein [Streptomyces spectabilis]MBB5108256.1 hypothetical protein [Streptomyces spectabilis]MCI3901017.1 hypothetical protein [Streptomyces spectabilis]QEV58518.1 hypothetical protein CP982_07190 [Streptomyces spectabilis]GGV45499.1 hypothetical protein GCM10010245_71170 [Streptomyces spectabilis]